MSSESDSIRVGINLPRVGSNPNVLRQKLESLSDAGYDTIEIPLDMLPLIIGGEVRMECVDFLKSILKEFDLLYSAHIGGGLNLRDEKNLDMQKKVLFSSIEICNLLNMNPLVLHYEFETKDLRIEERFIKLHIEAAEFASRLDVELCIENIEVERVDPVIRFLERARRWGSGSIQRHVLLSTES